MAELTERELPEIESANDSGLRPVMLVHGLWLLSGSWDRWRTVFEEHGYATLAPGWPDDPESIKAAQRAPDGHNSGIHPTSQLTGRWRPLELPVTSGRISR